MALCLNNNNNNVSSRFTNNDPARNITFSLVAPYAVFTKGGTNFVTGLIVSPSKNPRIVFRLLVRIEKRRSNSITPRLCQHPGKVYFEPLSVGCKYNIIIGLPLPFV